MDTPPQPRPFFAGLSMGFNQYFRASGVLSRHSLWSYLFLPGFLSLLLAAGTLTGIIYASGSIESWLDDLINLPFGWLDSLLDWVVWLVSLLLLALAFLFLHKTLVLIFLAPFLGRLAELIILAREGNNASTQLNIASAMTRSIRINIGNLLKELVLVGFFTLLGIFLLPPIGTMVFTVLILLTQSRYLGYGLMDLPLEFYGMKVSESVEWTRHRRSAATGVGAGYLALMAVPVIGWMLAPILGTVAGTLQAMDEFKLENRSTAPPLPPQAPSRESASGPA